MINPVAPLACPIDGLPLKSGDGSWLCESGHHFDLSRHGYLNLLPASQKTSRDPGDGKSMVAARRRVMGSGVFEALALELASQVGSRIKSIDSRAAVILDAGCGEGYYTEHMRNVAEQHCLRSDPVFMGTDISKWAILAAARKYKDVTWLVANNKRLPVVPGSVDIISSVFGFETWQPWAELQSSGQYVLVAHAGPLHLIELRKLIYENVTIHDAADDAQARKAGYRLVDRTCLSYTASLDDLETAQNILLMTPHGYRVAAGRKADLDAGLATLLTRPLTVEVVFRWYERC